MTKTHVDDAFLEIEGGMGIVHGRIKSRAFQRRGRPTGVVKEVVVL